MDKNLRETTNSPTVRGDLKGGFSMFLLRREYLLLLLNSCAHTVEDVGTVCLFVFCFECLN